MLPNCLYGLCLPWTETARIARWISLEFLFYFFFLLISQKTVMIFHSFLFCTETVAQVGKHSSPTKALLPENADVELSTEGQPVCHILTLVSVQTCIFFIFRLQEGLSRITEWAKLEGIFESHLLNTSLLKAGLTFGQIAHGLVQANFEYFQGQRLHDLSVSLFLYLTTLLTILSPPFPSPPPQYLESPV